MEGLRMAKRFAIYQEKYRGLLVDQANAVTEDSKKVDPSIKVLLCFASKYYKSYKMVRLTYNSL